jgi:type IV secretory pathway VirD2 relaxase
VRGRADDGADLVIARDYLTKGLRGRAEALVEQELGPRTALEIADGLAREVTADRFTGLDRALRAMADETGGVVDLRPGGVMDRDPEMRRLMIGRAQHLERLGLVDSQGPASWTLAPGIEDRLRDLGTRGDIIKTMHRAMAQSGVDRGADVAMHLDAEAPAIVGRLIERGLRDELSGSAYAVIDGVDGRAHHIRFRDLEATSDAVPGAIVELRRFEDRQGVARTALAVRSDLTLTDQITAPGATWLDRQLVAKGAADISDAGFGRDVRDALDARTARLASGWRVARGSERFSRAT